MATPIRFDEPLTCYFGEEVIEIEPIRGLRNLQKFEEGLTNEIFGFKERLEAGQYAPSHPAQLFTQSVNVPKLLKLACPKLTDELIDNATPRERMGVLEEATRLNNLGHLTLFFSPATLLEIAIRMQKWSKEVLMKEFPEETSDLVDFSSTFSALASTGNLLTGTSPSGKPEISS